MSGNDAGEGRQSTTWNARSDPVADHVVRAILHRTRAAEEPLFGPAGVLPRLIKGVLEAALEQEIEEHLRTDAAEGGGNERNGRRRKTLTTPVGPVDVDVPRDRLGTFTPRAVAKRQRRSPGVDAMIVSLTVEGLSAGEIARHLGEVFGVEVSREHVTSILSETLNTYGDWQRRRFGRRYPILLLDNLHVRTRESTTATTPFGIATGVTADGEPEILGLWAHDPDRYERGWRTAAGSLRRRGVHDVGLVAHDDSAALTAAADAAWPGSARITSSFALRRLSLQEVGSRDRRAVGESLNAVTQAPTPEQARAALDTFAVTWRGAYPSVVTRWNDWWRELERLGAAVDGGRFVCTADPAARIEARFRRLVRLRGRHPTPAEAFQLLYLTMWSDRSVRMPGR